MLQVKTKLGISPIENAGIGLFADQHINKGDTIWTFDYKHDTEYSQEDMDSANELDKEFLIRYCFKFNGYYYLCVDNARFFNHSNTPNCTSFEFAPDNLGSTIALRDIEIGEELTDDYSKFGLDEQDLRFNLAL